MVLIGGMYIGIMLGSYTCSTISPGDSKELLTAAEWQMKFGASFKEQLESEAAPGGSEPKQFPKTIQKFIVDYATVQRDDFNKQLEIGVPMDESTDGANEVLVLYTDRYGMPSEKGKNNKIGMDVKTALQNCNTVKVVLQSQATKKNKQQCIAIVPQWESYHVHKFMRMPKNVAQGIDPKLPLRYVSRSVSENGREATVPSWSMHTKPSFDGFVDYVKSMESSLKRLRPVLDKTVQKSHNQSETQENTKKSKVVVVMVCNKGQAHLFHNFVCNARAKGLDLNRIIMFATDVYTAELSKQLGIPFFYDENIFGGMPENAAARYGDKVFSQMMMAKVYCVHLVMTLGYDVLFQDVDVVWNKNPLEYLESEESKEWDMIFQDDGSRQVRYQPYSPNTGFYFVRNNAVTQYFFNSLLKMGDLVAKTKSHQAALTANIAEFVSWKGLRVKVWPKGHGTLFPGGWEYHMSKDYMRKMIRGEIKPYIFHMSWTQNKDNKQLFFDQMAEWYTKNSEKSGCQGLDCCENEPIIKCHYRDKPSSIPCKDSPPIDKGKPSFW